MAGDKAKAAPNNNAIGSLLVFMMKGIPFWGSWLAAPFKSIGLWDVRGVNQCGILDDSGTSSYRENYQGRGPRDLLFAGQTVAPRSKRSQRRSRLSLNVNELLIVY